MFKCKGCEAKGDEILHLRAIITEQQAALEKAQTRVMELAEPGVNRRMSKIDSTEPPAPAPVPALPQFPGYEMRPDPGIQLAEDES